MINNKYNVYLDEFTFVGGNTFEINIRVLDKSGIPVNLTDYTASMKISQFGNIRRIVTELSGTINIETSTITYNLNFNTTKNMKGKYVYQPSITKNGIKTVLKQGCFMVVPRVVEIVENNLSDFTENTLDELADLTLYDMVYGEV